MVSQCFDCFSLLQVIIAGQAAVAEMPCRRVPGGRVWIPAVRAEHDFVMMPE
jgi:hypothetical protein